MKQTFKLTNMDPETSYATWSSDGRLIITQRASQEESAFRLVKPKPVMASNQKINDSNDGYSTNSWLNQRPSLQQIDDMKNRVLQGTAFGMTNMSEAFLQEKTRPVKQHVLVKHDAETQTEHLLALKPSDLENNPDALKQILEAISKQQCQTIPDLEKRLIEINQKLDLIPRVQECLDNHSELVSDLIRKCIVKEEKIEEPARSVTRKINIKELKRRMRVRVTKKSAAKKPAQPAKPSPPTTFFGLRLPVKDEKLDPDYYLSNSIITID